MAIRASNDRPVPPPGIATALAQHAAVSDRAILVGNRAGVVGWANEAWTKITGFPLDATLGKPIAHFLGEAEIELELVDFVGQHYLEGRACTIEFPFETFDERSIWVHLEVQPIRNETGEIAEFVAVATDETERRARELGAARPPNATPKCPADSALPTRADGGVAGDELVGAALTNEARRVCEIFLRSPRPRIELDLALDEAPRPVSCNRLLLSELIRQLVESAVEAIGEGWGTVTVISGGTEAGRGHVSQAYPLVARSPELARAAWHFLEIHDSGEAVDPAELDAARRGRSDPGSRTHRLALATELARLLGGSLQLDSAPGCGTQALLLLPPASDATPNPDPRADPPHQAMYMPPLAAKT